MLGKKRHCKHGYTLFSPIAERLDQKRLVCSAESGGSPLTQVPTKLSSGNKTEVVGLECVLMAESETECDTPGLDTLGSECVIAHSQVDLHYGAETEIMTEEKRGLELEIHGSDLAKIQGLGTELGAVTCVEAIVAETDHDYIKVEHGGVAGLVVLCVQGGGQHGLLALHPAVHVLGVQRLGEAEHEEGREEE